MSLPKIFTIHKFAPPVFRDRLRAKNSISWAIKVNWFRISDIIGDPTMFHWVLWYVAYFHKNYKTHLNDSYHFHPSRTERRPHWTVRAVRGGSAHLSMHVFRAHRAKFWVGGGRHSPGGLHIGRSAYHV